MDLFTDSNNARLRRCFPWVDMALGGAVAAGLLILLLLASGLGWLIVPELLVVVAVVGQALLLFGVGAAWALVTETSGQAAARRPRAMGWANQVTLARALMVMIIAAFVMFPAVALQHAWWLAGLSLLALCLDGVDGWVARRTSSHTDFGARFDMEMDALFILVLAALLVATDVAGPWVLAMGIIRYAFMVAGWVWTWLQAPLPESFRRKLVCVWQIATMMVCLVPWVPDPVSTAALALALILLLYSFVVDIGWLYAHRHEAEGAGKSEVVHE